MMKEGIFTVWRYERGKGKGLVETVLGADVICGKDSMIGINYFYRS